MITREQSIDQFNLRIDEIINTKYILADKKINNLLKTVTASKIFYELISYCAEDFDYGAYLDSIPDGASFPVDNQKHTIAFGFSLLTNIDLKGENFLNILKKYYNADNFDQCYNRFCKEFLIPFKDAVLNAIRALCKQLDDSELDPVLYPEAFATDEKNDNTADKRDDDREKLKKPGTEQLAFDLFDGGGFNHMAISEDGKGTNRKYLTCHKDIQKIAINEKSKIIHNKSIKDDDKRDLLLLLDRFITCLSGGKKEDIRMSFICYKYAAHYFKKLESEVDDIERILKFCGAI